MRILRSLASVAAATALLLVPLPALAQSADPVDDGRVPLARQPDEHLPLRGTPWRLEGYDFRDRAAEPGPEVAAFMQLGPHDISASGGCTRIKGRFGTSGPAIAFYLRDLKKPDCAEQTTLVQLAMVSGLKKAASYEIVAGSQPSDDKLILRSAAGEEVLRFGLDDVSGLEDADWVLASYSVEDTSVPASADQVAVLSFRPDINNQPKRRSSGPMSGSTGCNGIVAEFYRHADALSFGEIEHTDAPCTPELTAQEEAMLAVLDATALRLDLPYDRLTLTSSDTGEQLELVSQRPLEGSTWLLSGGPLLAEPQGRATMRLADGVVSGEGPCGPYGAEYATDGVFITFRDVQGARDETCVDLKTEKAMLDGMRRSVRIDRRPAQLRLLDAFGATTVMFELPTAP